MRNNLRKVLVACLLAWPAGVWAQDGSCRGPGEENPLVATVKSHHFIVHTDLPANEAKALLKRLESTLRIAAKYWGRPLRDPIECYVVEDLSRWNSGSLPISDARILIERVGGATVPRVAEVGRRSVLKARVYARSDPGIAEHEIVHAYCSQVFGTGGPDWYKEGMAEMACHHRTRRRGVWCPRKVIHYLQNGPRRGLDQIVGDGKFTAPILASFVRLADGRDDAPGDATNAGNKWHRSDDDAVRNAKKSYYWSWALCHLLCNNANYNNRFRALGRGYLLRQDIHFRQVFASMHDEIEFELEQFLKHLDQGYRVDLCRWDWDTEFSNLDGSATRTVRVKASRGYQASGVEVSAGEEYDYWSDGIWTTDTNSPESTADGDAQSQGRLVGVVMHAFRLGDPIPLGAHGRFVASTSGQLYLRCQDHWHELADNRGVIRVRLRRHQTNGLDASGER